MAVWTVKVVWAVITDGSVVEIFMFAVAVELASVPTSVVFADVAEPCCGVAVIVTLVPAGMLLADISTEIGFVIVDGSVISGAV